MAQKKEAKILEIKPINLQRMTVRVVGERLITHKFSEKSKKEMQDKQKKTTKTKKRPLRKPESEFRHALYWLGKNGQGVKCGKDVTKHKYGFGFPAVAFKAATVGACRSVDGLAMTELRGWFHIIGEFVKIESKPPVMRTDTVRIGKGSTDLRYRPEFGKWHADLNIQFNADLLTAEQLINMVNIGGFSMGVGERRPSQKCADTFGMYHVE